MTVRLRFPLVFLPAPSKNRPASLSGGSRLRYWLCSSLSAHLDGGERQGLYFGAWLSFPGNEGSNDREPRSSSPVHANFYEKALFVKPTWRPLCGDATTLCPSRYASIRTLEELSCGSSVHRMRSVSSGQRRCNLRSGLPSSGWTKFAWRSHLRIRGDRAKEAALSCATLGPSLPRWEHHLPLGSFFSAPSFLPKLPPPAALGSDACCRAVRRPPR